MRHLSKQYNLNCCCRVCLEGAEYLFKNGQTKFHTYYDISNNRWTEKQYNPVQAVIEIVEQTNSIESPVPRSNSQVIDTLDTRKDL